MQIGPLGIASEFCQTSPVHGSSPLANGMVAFIQITATPDHPPSLSKHEYLRQSKKP